MALLGVSTCGAFEHPAELISRLLQTSPVNEKGAKVRPAGMLKLKKRSLPLNSQNGRNVREVCQILNDRPQRDIFSPDPLQTQGLWPKKDWRASVQPIFHHMFAYCIFHLGLFDWRPNVFRAFNGGGGQESRSTFLRNLGSLEFIVCTGDRKKVWSCIVYRLLHVREKVTSACRRYFLSAVLNRALWSPVCIYIYRLTTSPLIYICPGVSLCVANAVLSPYLPGAFYMSTANSEIQNQTVEIKSHCLFYAVHVEPQS